MRTGMTVDLPQVKYNVTYMPEERKYNPFVIYKIEDSDNWNEVTEYADLISCITYIQEEIRKDHGIIEKIEEQDVNMEVFLTTYDGFYIVKKGEDICCYEGVGLLPENVKGWLKDNKPKEINDSHDSAVASI